MGGGSDTKRVTVVAGRRQQEWYRDGGGMETRSSKDASDNLSGLEWR